MLLVLDVGNPRAAVGVYSEGKWIADWRVTTHLDYLADEYYVLLKSLLEDADLSFQSLSGAALASVVPPLTATFEELIVRIVGKKPVVVGPGVRTGIQIKIENPKEGDSVGGAIAPGLGIAADALVRRTAKLPKVELTFPENAVGRSTVAAMQSGLVIGYVGLVKELVARLKKELGGNAKGIGTGGAGGGGFARGGGGE